ncbi:MAG: hypothetical protein R6V48_06570 [Fidelibacterota bacterium]
MASRAQHPPERRRIFVGCLSMQDTVYRVYGRSKAKHAKIFLLHKYSGLIFKLKLDLILIS